MVGLSAADAAGVTSNNWSVRRLGPARWRKLHRLIYLAALLGAVHYVWLVKAWPLESLCILAVILGLLALRIVQTCKRMHATA